MVLRITRESPNKRTIPRAEFDTCQCTVNKRFVDTVSLKLVTLYCKSSLELTKEVKENKNWGHSNLQFY